MPKGCVCFASSGKSTAGTILPSTNGIWLKAKFLFYVASWGKIKINYFTLADQDWIGLVIFKKFADRTGSDSILSDQDLTRTEKFHSPLISAVFHQPHFFQWMRDSGVKMKSLKNLSNEVIWQNKHMQMKAQILKTTS